MSGSNVLVRLSRFSLRHRRLVVGFWLVVAAVGPAAVSLFGRWNCWLPKPPARLLRVEASPRPLLADHD